jgi:5'(3')-deoxyribonucleotidase
MIDPTTVAFDFDGVIADTMTLFLDIARSEYRIEGIDLEDITCYSLVDCVDIAPEIVLEISSKIVDGDYRHPLKIYEGACDVLSRIAECSNPLLFVTARPHMGPMVDWIRENIPLNLDQVEVVATGSFEDKTEVLLEKKITHFVEDRLETCVAVHGAGIVPVLFRQPWNRQPHGFLEVGDWAELARLMDFS